MTAPPCTTSDASTKCYENSGNAALMAFVPKSTKRALDVGCGSGMHARQLQARGMAVDGITISGSEHASAVSACENCWVHDLEAGLPAGLASTYDLIICSHVLEHLRWPERILLALKSRLQPRSGRLLVALPNVLFYKNRARLLLGRFEYQDSGIMDASHFRWFTFRSARRLVEQCGYRVIAHEGHGSAPIPLARRALPTRLTTWADGVATRLIPGLFSNQIIVVAAVD
jgi:SAM-dependent methyltransferase